MKNFLKIFLILFFGLFSNIQAYACDALNIEIGTKISKITNYLDFIQEDLLIELNDLDDEDKALGRKINKAIMKLGEDK